MIVSWLAEATRGVNGYKSEFLANEVANKLYVLGTLMKGWIMGELYGRAVVKV